jgi:hypothetical protein
MFDNFFKKLNFKNGANSSHNKDHIATRHDLDEVEKKLEHEMEHSRVKVISWVASMLLVQAIVIFILIKVLHVI